MTINEISIRPLRNEDLEEADRIFRLSFGTFVGLPDPMEWYGDADYVRTRFKADPHAALGAEIDGELVGSNFAMNWGSVGVFGPLTVRPDLWDKGIAKRLLEGTMEIFARWGTKHVGLFTFAHSAKHINLYRKFGFWPWFLTAIMSKSVEQRGNAFSQWSRYSEVPASKREESLTTCRNLTNTIYEGLDLKNEIHSVNTQQLGDIVLLYEEDNVQLDGMAICHCGAGTEGGSGTCYIKFGAVRPGPDSGQFFDNLLDACEAFAESQDMSRLVAGVSLGRREAYSKMIARYFRTDMQGVAMHKPDEPGYNRSDTYVIDDWR
ncbi:MAG: GNAT family N-acetyltransferase [Nitrososphaerales archaeon]